DRTVSDVSILEISETPGLGRRAGEVLVPQFHNKTVQEFKYTKNGSTGDNEIDAISGATVTTKAFVEAVNGGLIVFDDLMKGGGQSE
ncbi:MAG: FMN-binding protein, partial [Acetatifactor sp.]|nr:FMN-binding protein [Acetatifactor sp.]